MHSTNYQIQIMPNVKSYTKHWKYYGECSKIAVTYHCIASWHQSIGILSLSCIRGLLALQYFAFFGLKFLKACLHNYFLKKIINIIIICLLFFATRINVGRTLEIYTKTTIQWFFFPFFYMYLIGHNDKLSSFLNQNPYALYKVLIFHNYSCWAFLVSDATCYTYRVVILCFVYHKRRFLL